MIKKIIAGAMLALPLAFTSVPTKASTVEVIANPHAYNSASAPLLIAQYPRRHRHRVYIRAHYVGHGRHRHLVPGHWVYRN